MKRRALFMVGTLVLGGLLASCSGTPDEKATQDAMKKGFADRPKREELPPAQQQRYDDFKKMAEGMAKQGPGTAPPKTP